MTPSSAVRPAVVCSIRTQRMLLRALRPNDAPALCDLIAANLEFLRRWMAWAWQEPVGVEAKTKWLRLMRRAMLGGEAAGYGIFIDDGAALIGSIGTHPRIGAGAREIGYWIGEQDLRLGYTSEAAAALTKIGFEHMRLRRMEIHTDPDNAASIGVARKIGFREQVIVRGCVLLPTSPVRDSVIWSMKRGQYAGSFAAGVIEAMDRRGRRVL